MQANDSQNSNLLISKSNINHVESLVKFQIDSAMETEQLKLNQDLVMQAVKYIHDNPQFGYYLVIENTLGIQQLPICSSLMLTIQNPKSWWIQSVYVIPQARRKGYFKSTFKFALKLAIKQGVQKVKLYFDRQNLRAKNVYLGLGMHLTGQTFYGFDFVYSEKRPDLNSIQQKQKIWKAQHYSKQICGQLPLLYQKLTKIFQNSSSQLNTGLICKLQNEILGYCQYFYQFSQWRFGFIVYVNTLYLKDWDYKDNQNIVKILIKKLLEQKEGLKIVALRFIIKQDQLKIVQTLIKGGARDNHDVMEIKLSH